MIARSFLTAAMAAGALSIVAGSVPAQAKTLKVSTCLQRSHDQIDAYFDTFHTPINALKGDLKLRYLGGPEVTPRQKQAPALKRGLIDIIVRPTPYYGGLLAEARLPGVHNRSYDEIRANGGFDMLQEAWGKGLNARILAWAGFEASAFYVYTKFKPKLSTETGLDLTGIKMRSTGLYNAFLKAMSATPVTISPGDVYSGLERGVVQGIAWPRGSVARYGWQRFLKFKIAPKFYGATLMTIINLKSYAKLSKAQQTLLEKQGKVYEEQSDAVLNAKAAIDNAKLKEAGVEIIKLQGSTRAAYVNTIYSSKWAQNDQLDKKNKYIVDYQKLKSKMYAQPGS